VLARTFTSNQLELLKETVPNIGRVAVLSNPANPVHALLVTYVKAAAQKLGLGLQLLEARGPNALPSMYGVRELVDAGGLMSYGPSAPDLFRRSATFVDKILKGIKPADPAVQQPTKFELVISLRTAKALGLTIPPSLLGRADELIE
jgi:putative ABC transport system substrate-binding protein